LEEVRAQRDSQDDLLAQIAELDARYFDAHNRCDLDALRAFLAPDMESYHDVGGYLQGREAFMEVMQQFCAHPERSRRELIPGTLEAHRLAGVGAMAMGEHRFSMVESGADMGSGKMIIIWRMQGDEWQVLRIVSYDHKPPPQ
jgi:ketosteroid isomerase-like protein